MREIIDLRSDTVTQPTAQMRRAMYEAEVGDDYYHEDKTAKAVEERSAAIMGKEAALLVVGGSVGNIISIVVQTKPGDAIAVGCLYASTTLKLARKATKSHGRDG